MGHTIQRRSVLLGAAAASVTSSRVSVVLTTAIGTITIQLQTERAPLSTADFLKYVDARAYDGGRFFRVVRENNDRRHPRIDVVQGGTRPDAKQGPPVKHETTAITGLRHLDGTVSLTRDAPGTGSGAEFFVCVGAQPGLDFGGLRNPDLQGYAAFGQVTAGMDVVRRIWVMDASGHSDDAVTVGQILRQPVPILSARRI
jgi:peptidyl-prolyl cis-trans isomerase A (cyclophilin A)